MLRGKGLRMWMLRYADNRLTKLDMDMLSA